jgi:hypothetical protein
MSIHRLSFGQIELLRSDLAEVTVDEMVEMDLAMVEEYHEFLLKKLSAPFSLLINKKNSYTYTFDAQLKLATLVEIHAMAVVTNNSFTARTTNDLIQMPRENPWTIQIFSERPSALQWLEQLQGQLLKN